MGKQWQTIFWGSKITADGDCSHEIKKRLLFGRKFITKLDSILKSRDITLPTEVCLVKAMVFPIFMCGCESWTVKKAEYWRIDAFELWFEDSWESLGLHGGIQPLHPKAKQSWVFIGRTGVEAETPVLWPPDGKNWLICKDPDAGKDWRLEEKGTIEDEMAGWHHRLNGHEFEWTPGTGEFLDACHAAVHGVTMSWTRETKLNWLNDRKEFPILSIFSCAFWPSVPFGNMCIQVFWSFCESDSLWPQGL